MRRNPHIELAGVEFKYGAASQQVFIKDTFTDTPSIMIEDLPKVIEFFQFILDNYERKTAKENDLMGLKKWNENAVSSEEALA